MGFAHDDTSITVIRTSKIKNVYELGKFVHVYIDTFRNKKAIDLKNTDFLHLSELKNNRVPKTLMIDGSIYLLFWIENDTPVSDTFNFSAGFFSKNIELFTRNHSGEAWNQLNRVLPNDGELAYNQIILEPFKEIQLMVRTNFAKTTISLLRPILIKKSYYKYHMPYRKNNWGGMDVITYIITGMLLMMLLFSIFTYFQNKKGEFLYYALYAFCLSLMIFLKGIFYESSQAFNFFNEEYLDYFLLFTGYFFYIRFTRLFLNTSKVNSPLNVILVAAEITVILFLILFSFMYFTNKGFKYLDLIENISKFFMIGIGLTYVILGLIMKNRFMNFLVAGNVANLMFGGLSQLLIVFKNIPYFPTTGLFRNSLFYFEVGIFLEMIFFLLGLIYKNKIELIEKVQMDALLKQEGERREYEKQIAVLRAQQDERTRISADMHDELGSGVTAIRLLSEIAMQKTKDQPIEEIGRISNNANEVMSKMNAIIWSMNPGNDTLSSTISYMRSNASEYLDNFSLNYSIEVPDSIPDRMLLGNKRRNLFLVLKECLNNIIKHANATKVTIQFKCNDNLEVKIIDNGIGINKNKLNEFGNGLKNMQRRMESSGGTFSIISNNGTVVTLTLPIND
jgi:signal transduction histidine kinase